MKSIRARLVPLFLLMAILPCVLSAGFSYLSYRQSLLEQISQARQNSLRLVSSNVETMVEAALTISDLCYYDGILTHVITQQNLTEADANHAKAQIISTYTKYHSAFEQINVPFYIAIYATNGFEYCTLPQPELYDYRKLTKMSWFSSNEYFENDKFLISNYNDSNKNGEDNYVVSAIRLIRDRNQTCRGVIMINIPCTSVQAAFEDVISEDNTIYLVDNMMRVISCSDSGLIGTSPLSTATHRFIASKDNFSILTHADGTQYLACKYWISAYDWYLVEEIPLGSVLSPLVATHRSLIVFSVVLLAIFSLVAVSLANSISSPLRDFCGTLDLAAARNLEVYSHNHEYKEIDEISEKFNHLLARIKTLLQEIQQKERAVHKAELEQLKLQINPHFIYNTLFSIRCMVELGKQREASEMLGILANLLNTTLRTGSSLAPLSSCLSQTVQYFKLQKLRYGQSVQLEVDVADSLKAYRFPCSALQPLVENAIQHGLRGDAQPLRILLHGWAQGDTLHFIVQDNGRGMDAQRLQHLRESLCNDQMRHDSIGVANVHSRIRLLFGKPYGLTVDSAPGGGTCIHITVPVVQ